MHHKGRRGPCLWCLPLVHPTLQSLATSMISPGNGHYFRCTVRRSDGCEKVGCTGGWRIRENSEAWNRMPSSSCSSRTTVERGDSRASMTTPGISHGSLYIGSTMRRRPAWSRRMAPVYDFKSSEALVVTARRLRDLEGRPLSPTLSPL